MYVKKQIGRIQTKIFFNAEKNAFFHKVSLARSKTLGRLCINFNLKVRNHTKEGGNLVGRIQIDDKPIQTKIPIN
jgi:hypothetical protein